jgi:hypothetical protein
MSWEVIEFFRMSVFQSDCVVILGRINTKRNYLELQDLSSLVPTCFSFQSSCAILNLPTLTKIGVLFSYNCIQQLPCQANSVSLIRILHSEPLSVQASYCLRKASSLLIVVICPSDQIIVSMILFLSELCNCFAKQKRG